MNRLAIISLLAGLALAQAPPGGSPLLGGAEPLTVFRVSSLRGSSQVVSADAPGAARAIRVTVTQAGQPWDVELRASVPQRVQKDDIAFITFLARAVETSSETSEAYFTVYAQKASADWDKSMHASLAVGPAWQRFSFPFRWIASYEPSQSMFAFGMGGQVQTLEVAAIEVVGFPADYPFGQLPTTTFSYGGREANAPWRADAARRIDAIRKGDLTIDAIDASGRPAEGALVRVEMRRHAFPFGSALQATRLVNDSPDNRTYRTKVEQLFNSATLENDLKWQPWAGDWGSGYSQAQTLAALDWLDARRMNIRGHVLVWPGWQRLPQSVQAVRGQPDAAVRIPQMVLAHIDDIVRRTATVVDEWDVVNEPYTNHDLLDLSGRGVMRDWFARARSHRPQTPLYLNDYDILSAHGADAAHQDHYENTIRYLLDGGAPLSGLGMQGHFGGTSLTALPAVERILNRFAAHGLPIRITEFDIDTDDGELSAEYTRDFLTMVFSHSSVAGFQMWGFWEGAHWKPRAAMFRRDWAEKPNGTAFRRLVFDEWWSRLEGRTDGTGKFAGRAFYGTYEIAVSHNGVTRAFAVEHTARDGGTLVRVVF